MITLAVLLVVAAVGTGASRATRVPVGPLVVAAALAADLLQLPTDPHVIRSVLTLSATFLVFSLGAGLDLREDLRRAALRVGTAQILLLGLIGFGTARLVGLSSLSSSYVALALAASSSLGAVGLLRRRERMYEPSGRLIVTVLLFQDLAIVSLLSVLVLWGAGAARVLLTLPALAALGGLAAAARRWSTPWLVSAAPHDDERHLLYVLALLSTFLGTAHALGLPLVAGAFFAGVALAPFPSGGIVRSQVSSFQYFFAPLFYASMGAAVVIPDAEGLLAVGVLLLGTWLLLPVLLVPIARRSGLNGRAALEGSFLLATSGELSLVVALAGLGAGHLDEQVFGIIVAVTLVTMVFLPATTSDVLIRRIVHLLPSREGEEGDIAVSDHILIVGCGEGTLPLLERLVRTGGAAAVVDDDPEVVAHVRAQGVHAVRGDGSEPHVLQRAGLARAAVVLSTMRSAQDNARLIALARGRPVLVRVFSEAEGERVRALGGEPVISSHAARDAFAAWLAQARTR